ncbi:MAG TPA: DUF3298 domain-containing protein [Candidatus Ozemobacteraceae bacterium]|nr:DUF3298 domain-containing protein [Candidatus Ozemobacteraceae bacterium]
MKKISILFFTLFVLAFIGAVWAEPMQLSDGITAEMKEVTRTVPPPNSPNKELLPAELSIRYPVLSGASADNPVVTAINAALQNRLLAVAGEKPAASLDELLDTFVKGYEASVKETPDMPGGWSLKFEASIRHADADLIAIDTLDSVFQGGAHPTSNIVYLVFSAKTGKQLELASLLLPGKAAELTRIAEARFRKVRELETDENLEEAGFQFEKNRFALNTNFLVSKDGLAFCYNQYEIAPYALGTTELVIPWSELGGVIDPAGPAGAFLKSAK